MASRLTILPEPRFEVLAPALAERLAAVAATISPANFASLLDPLMTESLRETFRAAGASEGTVWIADEAASCLVPAYNSGPRAEQLVGKFQQPLDAGLVSLAYAAEQPLLVNAAHADPRHSPLVDRTLGQRTEAIIVVPLSFLGACRGVVSCVQLLPAPGPAAPENPAPEFHPPDLETVRRGSAVLGRLLELQLLSRTVGWNGS
jgi:GAF domain-containing protein